MADALSVKYLHLCLALSLSSAILVSNWWTAYSPILLTTLGHAALTYYPTLCCLFHFTSNDLVDSTAFQCAIGSSFSMPLLM